MGSEKPHDLADQEYLRTMTTEQLEGLYDRTIRSRDELTGYTEAILVVIDERYASPNQDDGERPT